VGHPRNIGIGVPDDASPGDVSRVGGRILVENSQAAEQNLLAGHPFDRRVLRRGCQQHLVQRRRSFGHRRYVPGRRPDRPRGISKSVKILPLEAPRRRRSRPGSATHRTLRRSSDSSPILVSAPSVEAQAMARVIPLSIVARNGHQAEYLVRSRAEQRGVALEHIDVSPLGGAVWLVSVSINEQDAERVETARLDEDTGVFLSRGSRH
jgi:hypothetical protein